MNSIGANPSPPSGWVGDFHPQAVEHARHTKNGSRRKAEIPLIIKMVPKGGLEPQHPTTPSNPGRPIKPSKPFPYRIVAAMQKITHSVDLEGFCTASQEFGHKMRHSGGRWSLKTLRRTGITLALFTPHRYRFRGIAGASGSSGPLETQTLVPVQSRGGPCRR